MISFLTSTLLVWVALEALSTLTPVGSSLIEAAGIEATGIILALVEGPTVGVGIAAGTWSRNMVRSEDRSVIKVIDWEFYYNLNHLHYWSFDQLCKSTDLEDTRRETLRTR